MFLGLRNDVSTFQHVISNLFSDILGKFVKLNLDNIKTHSGSIEEYLQHLDIILKKY